MTLPFLFLTSFAQTADTASHVATVVATIVLGLWAYSRFVAEQITRPPIEFTVEVESGPVVAAQRLVKITFRVRNAGKRECDAWLFWRLRVVRSNAERLEGHKDRQGQLRFTGYEPLASSTGEENLQPTLAAEEKPGRGKSAEPADSPPAPKGFVPVVPFRTFVGAGVTQSYPLVTALDLDCVAVAVTGTLAYRRSRSGIASLVAPAARLVSGLSPRETRLLTRDHTAAGVLFLASESQATALR